MASTPTSQITRVITTAATANVSTNQKTATSSYLVQGDTQITPRLEAEKAMVVHHGLQAS